MDASVPIMKQMLGPLGLDIPPAGETAFEELVGMYRARLREGEGTVHINCMTTMAECRAAILAVKEDIIPPTINLREADPACDLDYTPNTAVETAVEGAMSTSLGFGGHNACVAFRKVR